MVRCPDDIPQRPRHLTFQNGFVQDVVRRIVESAPRAPYRRAGGREREAHERIALRARFGDLPPMYVKVRTLLTRFWPRRPKRCRARAGARPWLVQPRRTVVEMA